MDSNDLKECPFHVPSTKEARSKQRLAQVPLRIIVNGILAWSGVKETSLKLVERRIRFLMLPRSQMANSENIERV